MIEGEEEMIWPDFYHQPFGPMLMKLPLLGAEGGSRIQRIRLASGRLL